MNTLEVLTKLKRDLPEVWECAEVVGRWIWVEFQSKPDVETRDTMKHMGFRYNGKRRCWQHPCGIHCKRSPGNPRWKYQTWKAGEYDREAVAV